jgi:hypothetical protein
MDDKTFDALTRGAGNPTSRRAAVVGLVGGLFGLGTAGQAAAQDVGIEGCRIRRCKKQVLDQDCLDRNGRPDNGACCQGLKCDNSRGVCKFKNGSGESGDFCRNDRDCNNGFFCKKNQCVPNKCGGS